MEKVILGTDESRLSRMQTENVVNQLLVYRPDFLVERKVLAEEERAIMQMQSIKIDGKRQKALLDGVVDVLVYSVKDLPREMPEGIKVAAYIKREDPREALLVRKGTLVKQGLEGMVVAVASNRQKIQAQALYKDATIILEKDDLIWQLGALEEKEYDAIITEAAGVKRMGFGSYIHHYISEEEIVPAAGQGTLAVVTRTGYEKDIIKRMNDEDAEAEAIAELSYVRELKEESKSPVGVCARIKGNKIYLLGMYYQEKTGKCYKESVIGFKNEAEKLGTFFANYMKRRYRS